MMPPRLIDLFDPGLTWERQGSQLPTATSSNVWVGEAVHRAKNLAQLARSLEHLAPRLVSADAVPQTTRDARSLTASYALLAQDSVEHRDLPCAHLLKAIATKLVSLFGRGAIDIEADVKDCHLPSDQRRALILIASELVINSLKYAYPDDGRGSIHVGLRSDGSRVVLSVADHGIGIGTLQGVGSGTGLLQQLARHCNGLLEYADNNPGLLAELHVLKVRRC